MDSEDFAKDERWRHAVALTALAGGIVLVGLTVAMIALRAGSPSGQDLELAAATQKPALYRVAMILDICAWLGIGSVLIAFAAMWSSRAPVRTLFLAACGIGQLLGMAGGFIRLEVVLGLGSVSGDNQLVLAIGRTVELLISTLFGAGALLTGGGLVLLAWTAVTLKALPRWVIGATAALALYRLVSVSAMAAGVPIPDSFPGVPLSILLNIVMFFAFAVLFRGPAHPARSAGARLAPAAGRIPDR